MTNRETAAGLPLHIPDRKAFCAPTAIAAITGKPIDEVHKKLRRVRTDNGRATRDSRGRKKPIKGVAISETLEVMRRFGYKPKAQGTGTRTHPKGWNTRMTLRAFLEDRGHMGPMIVRIRHHVIAVSRNYICDTRTGGVIPMMQYPKLGVRVIDFWQF